MRFMFWARMKAFLRFSMRMEKAAAPEGADRAAAFRLAGWRSKTASGGDARHRGGKSGEGACGFYVIRNFG